MNLKHQLVGLGNPASTSGCLDCSLTTEARYARLGCKRSSHLAAALHDADFQKRVQHKSIQSEPAQIVPSNVLF